MPGGVLPLEVDAFYTHIRALIAEGVVGDLAEVSATYPALADVAVVDLAQWLAGGDITGVRIEARAGDAFRWVFAGDLGWLAADPLAGTWTMSRGLDEPRTHSVAAAA